MTAQSSSIPPGWYPDPAEPSVIRYWDGEGWEDPAPAETEAEATPAAPVTTAPPIAPGPIPPQGMPGMPPPGWVPGPRRPANWPADWPFPPPGQVAPHGLALANPAIRLAARMIDLVILLAMTTVANAWFAVQLWRDIQPAFSAYMSAAMNPDAKPEDFNVSGSERAYYLLVTMFVIFTLLWFAYEVPSTANSGRTLGKRIMGIQVIPMEGPGRLTMGRSIRRWNPMGITPILMIVCSILFIFALLLPFFDNLLVVTDRYLHQALHDRSARTYVVTAPKKEVES